MKGGCHMTDLVVVLEATTNSVVCVWSYLRERPSSLGEVT